MISGYVVSKSVAEREWGGFWRYLGQFYARRMVRILPALVLCLLATTLASVLLIPESWLSSTVEKTGLAAFFGLSNFALVWLNDGYFSPRVEYNPFVHTWSLGVEEQFYVLFPLLFWFWLRWRRQAAVVQPGWALSVLPVLALVSLGFAYAWGQSRPDWAYYLLPARFWELAAGAMLYQWHCRLAARAQLTAPARGWAWLGLGLMVAGFVWAEPARFPYPWAFLPVLGTLFLLHAIGSPRQAVPGGPAWLQQPLVAYLGRISYALYLWHWPVYTLLRWTIGLDAPATRLLAVALTVALAAVSYHGFEMPLRRAGWLARRAPLTRVVAGLLLVAAGYGLAQQAYVHRSELSLSVTANAREWYPYPWPVSNVNEAERRFAGRNLFVIGNSHAGAYHTMLHEAEQRLGLKLHLFPIGACTMGHLLYVIGDEPGCRRTIEDLMNYINERGQPGDIVFFASLRTPRLSDQWVRFNPEQVLQQSQSAEAEQARLQALAENAELIERLQAPGLQVLFDAPKLVFLGPLYRCADAFNRNNPVCAGGLAVERNFLLTLREPVMASLTTLQARYANVHLWDPFAALCPPEHTACAPRDAQGRPLFFDGDHLSAWGNDTLYPEFAQVLARMWQANPPLP